MSGLVLYYENKMKDMFDRFEHIVVSNEDEIDLDLEIEYKVDPIYKRLDDIIQEQNRQKMNSFLNGVGR